MFKMNVSHDNTFLVAKLRADAPLGFGDALPPEAGGVADKQVVVAESDAELVVDIRNGKSCGFTLNLAMGCAGCELTQCGNIISTP